MEFMGTKEAEDRWGFSKATIAKWCREGKIKDAEQDSPGSPWRIPTTSPCPSKRKHTKKS